MVAYVWVPTQGAGVWDSGVGYQDYVWVDLMVVSSYADLLGGPSIDVLVCNLYCGDGEGAIGSKQSRRHAWSV